MPRNGSGTYALPVGNPVVTGTTISSTWANNTLTDIANTLTGSLAADGQTTASGNLNMGTNRIVNVGDPENAQDVATKYYVDQLIGALGTMAYQDADNVDITGGDIVNVNLDLHQMTNEIYIPVGPTALRTASPIQGVFRFNSDGPFYEGYVNGAWHRFLTVNEGSYTITYLAVGGGGGGGSTNAGGGGGGAGQVITSTTSVIPGTSVLTMTIGGGGAGAASGAGAGSSGSATVITGIASASGGGGALSNGGTSGNGYPGGATTNQAAGGGGGGAAAAGGNGSGGSAESSQGGSGGSGAETLITGTSQYFGGGGGGGAYLSRGLGGTGGGGNGNGSGITATSGSVNTGGGGGGAWQSTTGNGGSGIVYLSMPTLNYTGIHTGSPTVTTTGSNTVLKYTSSGTYTC